MSSNDRERPHDVLQEYQAVQGSFTAEPFSDYFHWEFFEKAFQIVIVWHHSRGNHSDKDTIDMEFDLIGVNAFFANSLRRLMLSEVPTMAFDAVHILNNTSIVQDNVLAHRLGLIPIKADPRLFDYKTDPNAPPNEKDTLEFELKIRCSHNKECIKKESSRPEDMYKNSKVLSKNIKWIPLGGQKAKFKDFQVGPIHQDILIAEMRPGQELDLKLFAFKGIGKDHAKFSPVAPVYYRFLPELKLLRPIEGEAAHLLQKCFSEDVINIKKENGKEYAEVNKHKVRNVFSNRNFYRYSELASAVQLSKVRDHCIFTIESVGALAPEDIFREAIGVLRNKCVTLLNELNSST